MIARINGRIIDLMEDSIVVSLGGVGIQLFVPLQLHTNSQVGDLIQLHTYLVVREDSLTLFGFSSTEQRDFFQLLLSVSGVGPKIALSGLSTLNPDAIRRAVFAEQSEVFSRIPGVGKKTAQKILLHLQDKVKATDGFEPVAAIDHTDAQVLEALISLGYSVVEAQAAIQSIPKDSSDDVESRIRLALQYFSV
jgi:Holliday junction DNA helicase RuvA